MGLPGDLNNAIWGAPARGPGQSPPSYSISCPWGTRSASRRLRGIHLQFVAIGSAKGGGQAGKEFHAVDVSRLVRVCSIGSMPADQPSILELLQVRQVAQALEPELRQKPRRGDIGVRGPRLRAARPGGDQPGGAQRADQVPTDLAPNISEISPRVTG